jgi:hypothetical protein
VRDLDRPVCLTMKMMRRRWYITSFFSEVEKSLNWFFFLRMGKFGSPERVVTAV